MSRSDTDTDVSQVDQRELDERTDLGAGAPSAETPASIIGRSPWEIFWGHFRQDRFALAGLVIIAVMILMAIFAPAVAGWSGHKPNQVNLEALDSYGLPAAPRWWPDKFDPQTGEKITASPPKYLLGAVTVVMVVSAAWYVPSAFNSPRGKTERTAAVLSEYARDHTVPGTRILVWGHLPEVYWQSDRPPATRFATTGFLTGLSGGRPAERVGMQYATPEAWADFEEDLRDHPPALVFDLAPADVRHASTAPPSKFPRFGDFLERGYEQVATIDGVAVYTPRATAK